MTTTHGRTHLVLVPGFGGFDALGQLEYYAGVTPLFRAWYGHRDPNTNPIHAEIHYFDNVPTAAVSTRARLLCTFLAKRMARQSIQPGDTISLVGHSTGGLDIRQLVWDLAQAPQAEIRVDGAEGRACTITHQDMLNAIKRLTFLSVPQRGTSLANWFMQHPALHDTVSAALRAALTASRASAVRMLESWATRNLGEYARADMLLAMQDALSETNEDAYGSDRVAAAQAREAFAQLELWARNVAEDFGAIHDLTCGSASRSTSPAHFDDANRLRELDVWKRQGIVTRSYATMGQRPFEEDVVANAKPWSLVQPWTWPANGLRKDMARQTDVFYQAGYRACLGGPFVAPLQERTATWMDTQDKRTVEDWENDGVVNTASMLWPNGPDTRLVKGDHADIIGHFRLEQAVDQRGRRYHTYDLLRSNSEFTEQSFQGVWHDVFDFCTRMD